MSKYPLAPGKAVALEVSAAVTILVVVAMALGEDASFAGYLPLLLVVAYWLGKWRQSGQKLDHYFAWTITEDTGPSNVVLLRTITREWYDCRPCKLSFKTEAKLLAHQLDEHGDELLGEAA